jgi:hypothetical protein
LPGNSWRAASTPHHGQCFIPTNIAPKQDGQEAVAREEPHHSQRTLSALASPAQFGHLSVRVWESIRIPVANEWTIADGSDSNDISAILRDLITAERRCPSLHVSAGMWQSEPVAPDIRDISVGF